MFRDALFIARKDLKYTLRERETILWVFIMPVVFFYFIGTITAGFGPSGSRVDKIAVQADESSGFLTEQLLLRLAESGYEVVRPDSAEEFLSHSRQLTVPGAFTDSVLAGHPVALQFVNTSDGLLGDYDGVRTQRAIYTTLADVIVVEEMGQAPTAESFARLNAMPRALSLEVKPAGERKKIPTGFEQAIPGIMVMFTLMVMATSGAILLVIERRQGLLRRLAATPIHRLSVVLGKWGGKLAIGIVQIAFAMLAGTVLFKMDWGPDLAMVIIIMFVYGMLMAALGVVLGSLARSEGQAIAIGVVAANVLAALGGCWWPIEITPAWMQKLQLFLPTGWAMNALHQLISFGGGPESVTWHLTVMLAVTGVLLAVGVKVFRYE